MRFGKLLFERSATVRKTYQGMQNKSKQKIAVVGSRLSLLAALSLHQNHPKLPKKTLHIVIRAGLVHY